MTPTFSLVKMNPKNQSGRFYYHNIIMFVLRKKSNFDKSKGVFFGNFTVNLPTLYSPSTGFHSKHLFAHPYSLAFILGFQTFSPSPSFSPHHCPLISIAVVWMVVVYGKWTWEVATRNNI